jgi:N-acetylmuramoyl-L-alanine amidase
VQAKAGKSDVCPLATKTIKDNMPKKLIFFLAFLLLPFVAYGKTSVLGFRASEIQNNSRFVLDLSENAKYKVFTLSDPMRVVIDIPDAKWDESLPPHDENRLIKSVRYSENPNNSLRVVLDINQPVVVKKSFILDKTKGSPLRLVIDLEPTTNIKIDNTIPQPITRDGNAIGIPIPVLKERRKPLIVIDAGHGGHDPGTIGDIGIQEKEITLDYAKELRAQLLATGKYDVYMVRSRDIFIPLKDRVTKARNAKGDLFVSLHVNSHINNEIEGLSIYTLSENASDKEAEALANKENKEGLITGVDMQDKADDLADLFIEMAQRDTKNLSASFAETIISQMKNNVKLLQNPHRFAGFRVLTGADIPSVLIELGYITNKKEERLLKSENYKNRLAKALVEAINEHFNTYQIE